MSHKILFNIRKDNRNEYKKFTNSQQTLGNKFSLFLFDVLVKAQYKIENILLNKMNEYAVR